MANHALLLNPPTGLDIHITTHGSDWYWTVFAVLAFFTLLFVAGAYTMRPANERVFFFGSILSTLIMAIGYYTMASDLGWVGIDTEFFHVVADTGADPQTRQIFYTRYVAWFLSFPMLVGSTAILAAVPWPTALFGIVSVEVFVVSLLIGSLIHSTYKWGYFVFGVVSLALAGFTMIYSFSRSAALYTNSTVHTAVLVVSSMTTFLLALYPIAWGLADGGNVIKPDSEAVFYGVLDLAVFVLTNTVLQFLVRSVDFVALGLASTSRPLLHNEKLRDLDHDTPVPAAGGASVTAPADATQAGDAAARNA